MTEDILNMARERAAALVAQDWAVVDAQLHPQFVYTNSQGNRLAKAAYLDFLTSGPLRWRNQSLEDVSVVHVEGAAVLHGIVVDDLLVDGEPRLWRFATTQTYVRVGDRWSNLAGHTAPLDDPEA